MARQQQKHDGTKGQRRAASRSSSLDPRLVALVKYLARCAAERDYEALQSQMTNQTKTPENEAQGAAGADS